MLLYVVSEAARPNQGRADWFSRLPQSRRRCSKSRSVSRTRSRSSTTSSRWSAEGDPEGARARRPARERGVQGREGAAELPAGADRPAPSAGGRPLDGQPRQDPSRQGGPRLDGQPAPAETDEEIVYEIVTPEEADPAGRAHLSALAHRQVAAQPRGGRHRRGQGPRRHEGVRGHQGWSPSTTRSKDQGQGLSGASLAAPTTSPRGRPVAPPLPRLPAAPGSAQILGPGGAQPHRRPSREPAALGGHPPRAAGKPAAAGQAPAHRPLAHRDGRGLRGDDLSFHQRLLFERLMGRYVPRAKRRDLKPPPGSASIRDRAVPANRGGGPEEATGPVRPVPRPAGGGPGADGPPQALAAAALRLRLRARPRPSPRPRLPLRAGAELRRALPRPRERRRVSWAGAEVGEVLAGRGPRPDELRPVLPPSCPRREPAASWWCPTAKGSELYPVAEGPSSNEARSLPLAELGRRRKRSRAPWPRCVSSLRAAGRDDRPWLLAWITCPRSAGRGHLVWTEDEPAAALASRVRQVLT